MRVHGKRILVRQDKTASETEGGIVIPEQMQGKLPTGTILGVGEGHLEDVPFRVGNKVLFTEFGGVLVFVEGEELMVVDWDDVLLVLGENDGK